MLPHNTADHILHSTNCKNFCGGPPQQQISTTYEFRSCKRKLLNTLATPFCRFAVHQKSQKPQQITIVVHNPRSQHTAKGAQPHESWPQTTHPAATESQTLTQANTRNDSQKFSDHPSDHLGKCKKPPRIVQQKITWSERFQRAHGRVQARSSRKTATSTRVRASGTV